MQLARRPFCRNRRRTGLYVEDCGKVGNDARCNFPLHAQKQKTLVTGYYARDESSNISRGSTLLGRNNVISRPTLQKALLVSLLN